MSARSLLSQLKLDARVAWRHRFFHAVVGVALLLGILVRFALPAQVNLGPHEYVHDATPGRIFSSELKDRGLPSEEAVRAAVREDARGIGIILRGDSSALIIRQGHEDALAQQWMRSGTLGMFHKAGLLTAPNVPVSTLRAPSPPIPFNGTFLPLALALDTVIVGLFFGAVMVFQEKTEGTLRFYRVTPGGSTVYLASKLLVNLGMALLGCAAMFLVARPSALVNGPLLLIVALAAAALTAVGLGASAFFDNLSAFFYPLTALVTTLSLPMAAYLSPSLQTPWVHWMPTWHVMFSARELLFPSGREGVVVNAVLPLTGLMVVSIAAAWLAIDRRIMKEVA